MRDLCDDVRAMAQGRRVVPVPDDDDEDGEAEDTGTPPRRARPAPDDAPEPAARRVKRKR